MTQSVSHSVIQSIKQSVSQSTHYTFHQKSEAVFVFLCEYSGHPHLSSSRSPHQSRQSIRRPESQTVSLSASLSYIATTRLLFDFYYYLSRLEVLGTRYDTDKKEKLDKWETWRVKIKSILAFNRNRLNDLKSEDPSADPTKIEEQLAKAKVKTDWTKSRNTGTLDYSATHTVT